MATRAKYLTHCTVCDRDAGAMRNWEGGRMTSTYRVARHATTDTVRSTTREGRRVPPPLRTICGGSGVLVTPELVWPAGTAPQGPERQPEGPGGDGSSQPTTATR